MFQSFFFFFFLYLDFYCEKVLNYRIISFAREPCRLSTSSCITLVNCVFEIFFHFIQIFRFTDMLFITSSYYPSDVCRICSDAPLFILILGLLVFFLISLAGILSILSFVFPEKQLSASLSFFLLCLLFH